MNPLVEAVVDPQSVKDSWMYRLSHLVLQLETWGKKLVWSTRRIEKKMRDSMIDIYEAPGLLLQADFCRILLEPITHAAPGADGVVDLYLLPGN